MIAAGELDLGEVGQLVGPQPRPVFGRFLSVRRRLEEHQYQANCTSCARSRQGHDVGRVSPHDERRGFMPLTGRRRSPGPPPTPGGTARGDT
jgi:hypothetical protein